MTVATLGRELASLAAEHPSGPTGARLAAIRGALSRAGESNDGPQTAALRCAAALLAVASETSERAMYDLRPDGRVDLDAALSLARRCADLAGRFMAPEVWR